MFKINIICVGKIKERYLLYAINEYLKRLSKYAKVNIIELEDEKVQNHTPIDIQNIESRKILTKIKDDDYLIILDLKGDEYDSVKLASYFQSLEDKGIGNIFIAIGGSLGFNDEIRKRANKSICFSKLTFPHQLIRVFLLEQLYRCYKINRNENYHH